MAVFLLWNVQKKPTLDSLVQILVRRYEVDVVLLVEYPFGTSQLDGMLAVDGILKMPSSKRFGVFVRRNHRLRKLKYRLSQRVNLWQWQPENGQEGLVVLLHGLNRMNYDDSTRRVFFRRIADTIRRCEAERKHNRTIVAGDLNAQPFESAIAASDGLHAIGVRSIKKRTVRAVHPGGIATDFFYNPMWRVYGQQPAHESGSATHYWLGGWGHELAWQMLDQVVMRPGESCRFPESQLEIITKIGAISLLDSEGIPDSRSASDHLPLIFHWNL